VRGLVLVEFEPDVTAVLGGEQGDVLGQPAEVVDELRDERARTCSIRSISRTRLASPVIASCSAWCSCSREVSARPLSGSPIRERVP
jgi:hypothetical protein